GTLPCRACPAGTFADQPGVAACVACPQGSYPAPQRAACEQCAPGLTTRHAGAVGAHEC
ncbi:hypothetical protein T484DRAFT_1591927, partial [Baffinella frigidus]